MTTPTNADQLTQADTQVTDVPATVALHQDMPESDTAELEGDQVIAAARKRHIDALGEMPLVAAGPATGFLRGTAGSIRGVWQYRELLAQLVRKELKSKYKDSVLGFLWSLLRPLALLLVYYFAIGKFLGAEQSLRNPTGIKNFAIYIYSGLTAWSLFGEIVGGGSASIVANGGLIKKIFLPREVFPLAVIGSALFNFFIQVGILFIATFVAGAPPKFTQIVWVFAGVAILLLWGMAWAFLLSAVNVYLRDVQYLVEIALLVGFWSCPVVYSWAQVVKAVGGTGLEDAYLFNPIAIAVFCFQKAFRLDAPAAEFPPNLGIWVLIAVVIGAVLVWVFQRAFARMQANFAQEL